MSNNITKEIADLIGMSPEEIYEEEMFFSEEFESSEDEYESLSDLNDFYF